MENDTMIPPHLEAATEELKGKYVRILGDFGYEIHQIRRISSISCSPVSTSVAFVDIGDPYFLVAVNAQIFYIEKLEKYTIEVQGILTELEVVKWKITS